MPTPRTEEGSLDFSFEAALGAICGNDFLKRMQSLVHETWIHVWVKVGKLPGDKHLLHDEHLGVSAHFRRGDLAGAKRLFAKHLDMAPAATEAAARSRRPGTAKRIRARRPLSTT
jgi:DNA-binding GntR family transcriptional regulator